MVANDVYTIAKALPKEEYMRLFDIIKSDLNQPQIKLKNKTKLPDFTMEDGLRFLLKNHIIKTKRA
jgi:hypothetical protein